MEKIKLITLQGGSIIDFFDEELNKVLANIEDVNTSPDAMRSITIKVSIKPDKARRAGTIKVQCQSSLAPIKPSESVVLFDSEDGKMSAYEEKIAQTPTFPELDKKNNVTPFRKEAVND